MTTKWHNVHFSNNLIPPKIFTVLIISVLILYYLLSGVYPSSAIAQDKKMVTTSLIGLPSSYFLEAYGVVSASNFSIYENTTTHGVKFQYPMTWQKSELLTDPIDVIEFMLTSQNASGPTASITISIEKGLPKNITTLDQFVRAADKSLNATFGDVNVTKSGPVTLAGFPALERDFTVIDLSTGGETRIAQTVTLANNTAYTITYTAEAHNYPTYLPIAQGLTKSFQIVK
jgi:hypothetical protein